ncbi:MAG: cobyrinate a,c-diamide synthase [Thermoleophilia bacterium]
MIPLAIGGVASGVGKTTVAIGLMGAFRRQGIRVAPFKTGPDYIDPGYHLAATGVPSRNLDTWLTSAPVVQEIYARGAAGADVAVIEGAMGLFDGRAGVGDQCSTAEIARLTGAAVVLVVDCARQARSLAPVLAGFAAFDRRLNLAGAILNNVGSPAHRRILEDAAREAGVPLLGVLPRRRDISLDSRHLGLVQAEEPVAAAGRRNGESVAEVIERIIDQVEGNVDLEAMLELSRGAAAVVEPQPAAAVAPAAPVLPGQSRIRLAVARDEAFSFYYLDSLEALEVAGAELIYFSPLHDPELPACDGLYLGGGYPEMFAAGLEANASMRVSLATAVNDGLPVYAECGGLVYLCRELEVDGRQRSMAGALPLKARMTGSRQALGYVEAEARTDNLMFASGERVRGHEFHWSAIDWQEENLAYDCFSSREPGGRVDGFSAGNLLASYVHINFAGNPRAAERLIEACAGVKGASVRASL